MAPCRRTPAAREEGGAGTAATENGVTIIDALLVFARQLGPGFVHYDSEVRDIHQAKIIITGPHSISQHHELLAAIHAIHPRFDLHQRFLRKTLSQLYEIMVKENKALWNMTESAKDDWVTTIDLRLRNLFRVTRMAESRNTAWARALPWRGNPISPEGTKTVAKEMKASAKQRAKSAKSASSVGDESGGMDPPKAKAASKAEAAPKYIETGWTYSLHAELHLPMRERGKEKDIGLPIPMNHLKEDHEEVIGHFLDGSSAPLANVTWG